MKRVVIEETKETIVTKRVMDDTYVIGVNNKKQWGILRREQYGKGPYRIDCFEQITMGNSWVNEADTIDEALRIGIQSYNFTFYQFPDFRSAMQYYLEQTK